MADVLTLIREGKVSLIDYLVRVAGILDRDVPFGLTTSMWAALAEEIGRRDMAREAVSPDPAKFIGFAQEEYEASRGNLEFRSTAVKPTPSNFRQLRVGHLHVYKADSDDQRAVNEANMISARRVGLVEKFQWKKEHLRAG